MTQNLFNWENFLSVKNTNPTSVDWEVASREAGDWRTCFCGKLCLNTKKNEAGEPINVDMYTYGEKFNDAIKAKNLPSAKYWAFMMQKRDSSFKKD